MIKVALQLYSIRDYTTTREDLEASLKKVYESGFRYVETAGYYGLSATEFDALAKKYGLSVVSTHTGFDALLNNYDQTVADHKTFGATSLGVPAKPGDKYPDTLEGYAAFAQKLGEYAEKLAADGIVLSYHNHEAEFVLTDSAYPMKVLLDNAPKVNLQLDTGNALRGHADPAAWLSDYSDRLHTIHFKDVLPDKEHEGHFVDSPIGEGLVDWKSIAPIIKAAGTAIAIIEIESFFRDPWEVLKTSHDFVAGLLA